MNVSRLLLAAAVLSLGACSTMPPVTTAQASPTATRVIQPDAARVQAINDVAARENVKVYWIAYPQKVTVITGPTTTN